MSVNRRPFTNGLIAALATATAFSGIAPAFASKPVPKTIVGCVFDGTVVSSDGYDIHPRNADGKEVDLRPFEGHAVTISGDLLPGDAFIIKKAPRDSGPCKMIRPGR